MLFDVVPENFFSPLAAPGKTVYWECIKRLFAITGRQLSFGVERDVLADDLDLVEPVTGNNNSYEENITDTDPQIDTSQTVKR